MTKSLISLLFGILLSMPISAQEEVPDTTTCDDNSHEEIEISCNIFDIPKGSSIPRTPPRIPIIYFNRTEFSFVFDSPCYDCTLYLVDVTNDTVVYTTFIPFGSDVVYIPSYLSGEYELHIHRGNICFYGMIIL